MPSYSVHHTFRPDDEEQPTPRQLEMLLEESGGASSPDSGTAADQTAAATTAGDELLQLEALEREMEGNGAPLVRRSVTLAERQRLLQEMAELERLEAAILRRRSVCEADLTSS